jgi:hypothetical protein
MTEALGWLFFTAVLPAILVYMIYTGRHFSRDWGQPARHRANSPIRWWIEFAEILFIFVVGMIEMSR